MKNKGFISALCIILSMIIASATLMAGATDTVVDDSTESTSTTVYVPDTVVPTKEVVSTTEKPIDEMLSELVSKNELEDDLSEIGSGITNAASEASGFLNSFIKALEKFRDKLVDALNLVFRFFSF